MDWTGVQGCITGKLLPTGKARDEIDMDGTTYSVSVVDAGNLVIYARAEDFGIKGTESPDALNADKTLLEKTEKLRGLATQRVGLVKDWREAREKMPYNPFITLITGPVAYDTYTGEHVGAEQVDIVARISVMLSYVRAFPGTATACTGCAARIPGSLVYDTLDDARRDKQAVSIGHATGTITVNAEAEYPSVRSLPKITKISFLRTARVLMDGIAYVRASDLG
jgi:2-methylaconitate cis-trans-isomerase PrpF